jgi:hypothetical protein
MEHLDHQVLRTFIEAPPRLGRTRSPPTSLAGYRAGGRRARAGHRSMTTRRMLLLKRRPAPGAPKKYSARPRGRPGSTAANQLAGRSMHSRVEPTDSMPHAIASVPAGDDHVLKSGSRTRLAEILSMASIVVKTGRASSSMIDGSLSLDLSIDSLSSRLERDSMPSRSIDASMEPSSSKVRRAHRGHRCDAVARRAAIARSIIDSRFPSNREGEREREREGGRERRRKGRTHGMGSARVGFPAEGGGLRRQSSGWVGRCRRRLG